MTQSIPTLTPAERKRYPLGPRYWPTRSNALDPRDFPPALGTLEQRLQILVTRLGGQTRVRASDRERREYQRWLAENDPTASNPYAKGTRS
jgi:hypothetical protein